MKPNIGFVCAINNPKIFFENLGSSSAWLLNDHIGQGKYLNISKAYNDAIKILRKEILVFAHQDIYLPWNWLAQLERALEKLQNVDWGVLGVAGASFFHNTIQHAGHIRDRDVEWNMTNPIDLPKQVQTIDELLLIIKNDGSLVFDEEIPSCDFYGADICLQSKRQGKKNYVIDAYLHHNSLRRRDVPLPEKFHASREYMMKKWKDLLPVATTCTILYP